MTNDLDAEWLPRHSREMVPHHIFPYDQWLFSGQPIYISAGVDYSVTTENAKSSLYRAARSRGLRLVVRSVPEYDGFIFQAYHPDDPRPLLPPPPVADFTKESYKFLFCSEDGCVNRLRPHQQITGKCDEHSDGN